MAAYANREVVVRDGRVGYLTAAPPEPAGSAGFTGQSAP